MEEGEVNRRVRCNREERWNRLESRRRIRGRTSFTKAFCPFLHCLCNLHHLSNSSDGPSEAPRVAPLPVFSSEAHAFQGSSPAWRLASPTLSQRTLVAPSRIAKFCAWSSTQPPPYRATVSQPTPAWNRALREGLKLGCKEGVLGVDFGEVVLGWLEEAEGWEAAGSSAA